MMTEAFTKHTEIVFENDMCDGHGADMEENYECTVQVKLEVKQFYDWMDCFDLDNDELAHAVTEIYHEFLTRGLFEADGRVLLDDDVVARDNAFDELISEIRHEKFHEECLSNECEWWVSGLLREYADKVNCHTFAVIVRTIRTEYHDQYDDDLSLKLDAEDIFGWFIYFASQHINVSLEKVWVDKDKNVYA